MKTGFFWWPAAWASGHNSYQTSLLTELLGQDRHPITVITDEAGGPPEIPHPHQLVTYKAVARRAARITVRDYGTELPALRAVKRSGVAALITNAAFVAPQPRSLPLLSIVYETDFFDPSPWHWFEPRMIQRMAALTTRALANATAVFGISQHTVDRIVRDFAVAPSRALVAVPAVEACVHPSAASERLLEKYVAQVGWFHPRKDLALVVSGWVAARRQGLTQDLVLIGRPGPYDRVLGSLGRQVVELAEEFIGDVHLAGHVSRSEYLSLLAGADALIVGSQQEGFCIPVVEAFALGTPVVAVDRTALSEVAGPVGTRVAASASDLARGIIDTVSDPPDAAPLRAYAAQFTAAAQTRPYLDVLDALEEGRWR